MHRGKVALKEKKADSASLDSRNHQDLMFSLCDTYLILTTRLSGLESTDLN